MSADAGTAGGGRGDASPGLAAAAVFEWLWDDGGQLADRLFKPRSGVTGGPN
jgi:hypothetical protein